MFKLLKYIVLAITLASGTAVAQQSKWVGKDNAKVFVYEENSLFEYNFVTGYKSVLSRSLWQVVDSFATLSPIDALQRCGRPVVFTIEDSILITFSGSGLVYGLRPGELPKRIDNTYFGGYNFDAFRFIHKDEIVSFGGHGFWMRNNNVLYFDTELHEWERLSSFVGLPSDYAEFFSAQSKAGEYIIANFPDPDVAPEVQNHEVYEFNMNGRSVSSLGVFSFDLDKAVANYAFIGSVGRYFLMEINTELIVGDIVANKLYKVRDIFAGTAAFNGYEGVLISGEDIVLIYSASTMSNPNMRIEVLSVEELLARCDELDKPVYVGRATYLFSTYTAAFLSVLLGIMLLAGFLIRYNLAQPGIEKQFAQSLSESQQRVLRYLLLLPIRERATIMDIDKILDTGDKSWENQRKIRSKCILGINQRAESMLGYLELIQRVPNPDDMRERTYQIALEHRTNAATLLRHL